MPIDKNILDNREQEDGTRMLIMSGDDSNSLSVQHNSQLPKKDVTSKSNPSFIDELQRKIVGAHQKHIKSLAPEPFKIHGVASNLNSRQPVQQV